MFDFQKWLCETMQETGITKAELCRRTGLAYLTLRSYIAGDRTPSLKIFLVLVEALGKRITIE